MVGDFGAVLTMIFYLVPFLNFFAYPFMLLSTLVHEMGHGFCALLLGGNFESFKMYPDGSGVASISGNFGRVSKALIAASGLIGPSLVAALFFFGSTSKAKSRFLLISFGLVLILSIMLVIRNVFGVFFVSLLIALCFYFSFGPGKNYSQLVLAFLATELALSVFSRSDYLFTDKAITSAGIMPSDVAQIAENLILPYWFWGILCGLISFLVLLFGFRESLKK
jgi:hypothetical protein